MPSKKAAEKWAGKGGTVERVTHENGKRRVKRFKVM